MRNSYGLLTWACDVVSFAREIFYDNTSCWLCSKFRNEIRKARTQLGGVMFKKRRCSTDKVRLERILELLMRSCSVRCGTTHEFKKYK